VVLRWLRWLVAAVEGKRESLREEPRDHAISVIQTQEQMEDAEETVLYTVTFRLARRLGFGVRSLGVLTSEARHLRALIVCPLLCPRGRISPLTTPHESARG
jgi:hypothetical protein